MEIQAEPVGDLAILSRLIQETGLVNRIDEFFPCHHLWQGPQAGKTLLGLLMYILSENDHRLSSVEQWAQDRQQTLSWLLEEPDFQAAQFNDDRLGNLLDLLSKDDQRWEDFQRRHNESLIRLYDLRRPEDLTQQVVRIDSTTAQAHQAHEGLFQSGHNSQGIKLPQIKMMLLAWDQANLPLALQTVAGNLVDDQLYTGVLQLAWRQGLPQTDVLVVGDSKLGNQANMAFIADSGNFYLSPLAQRQFSPQELRQARQWISQHSQGPQQVERWAAGAKEAEVIALVQELPSRTLHYEEGQSEHKQRLFAVCSLGQEKKALHQLEERVTKAQAAVCERFKVTQGRKTLRQVEEAQQAVEKILATHKATTLFTFHIESPPDKKSGCKVTLQLDQQAYEQEKELAGWRVLATNAPPERLSAREAVLCYWEEYRIEQQFHLLLTKCTALQPIYLKKDHRIVAMLRILMLALQYSNLWQYILRLNLSKQQQPYLNKLVPGNPGMKVHRPTTALVLSSFKSVQLIFVRAPDGLLKAYVQGLQKHHLHLLKLLQLPHDLYSHPLCQRT